MFTFSFGQNFSDFINKLEDLEVSQRQSVVDSILKSEKYFPITEDTLAHFVLQTRSSSPSIAGDFTEWDPNIITMTNIAGTDLWYRTLYFESDARLDYQFVYNDSIWINDPLNPNTVPGGFGYKSEIRMPNYQPPVEINYVDENLHGSLQDSIWYSPELGDSRKVTIYLPSGYSETLISYPLVLVHDGNDYISYSKMDNILDNLISDGKIKPLIAIFVSPVERSTEYSGEKKEQLAKFIIDGVLKWANDNFRIKQSPKERLVMGSSLGGNISMWMGTHFPNVFGNVGAFSPFIEYDLHKKIVYSDKLDLNIFVLHGTYDHLDGIQTSVAYILPILDLKNYNYLYLEYHEGHSYGLWRAHIDDLLLWVFPANK